ncbi:hypothetical protein DUNSADRAFT_9331 [Dunaliella salina]|uniref:Uncharacterized protein n=1 Tax=Dunaliella salina TaxID=3046 RepID=A0ABQ7H5E8_DUNSA|nr:hypothetical protein DUNSADRAFT_9331 [Dunaliella salina]|eukprot:KAF5842072.1 hypothetical protein DUNSADRAFT_9331 [Dunaliella salina]
MAQGWSCGPFWGDLGPGDLTEPFDHVLVAVYNNGHLPVNIHVDAQLGHKPLALPLMWYIIHNIRPVIWPGGKHFMAATIAVVALYLISRKISSRFQAARARAPSVQPFGPKLAGTEHGNCTSIETPFKACMGHLGEEAASAGDRTAADAEGYRGSTPGLPGNNVAAADKESCMHDGSAACMNSRNVAIVFASEEALLVEK